MLKFLQKTDSHLGDATPNTSCGRGHHLKGFCHFQRRPRIFKLQVKIKDVNATLFRELRRILSCISDVESYINDVIILYFQETGNLEIHAILTTTRCQIHSETIKVYFRRNLHRVQQLNEMSSGIYDRSYKSHDSEWAWFKQKIGAESLVT